MKTPFLYLRDNIDCVNFQANEKYEPILKQAFSNVLEKLDNFFVKNDLYSVVDLDKYADNIIKNEDYLTFSVENELENEKFYAVHELLDYQNRKISICSEFVFPGDNLESILCHEFIHDFTIGREEISYKKDDLNYQLLRVMRCVFINDKNGQIADTVINPNAVIEEDQEFICEAYTEMLTQKIYPNSEYASYEPQIKMIKFCNAVLGERKNLIEFLRGTLLSLEEMMGSKNYKKFSEKCDDFHENGFDENKDNYLTDNDYLEAQSIFVSSVCDDIIKNPDMYKPSEVANVLGTIKAKSPVYLMEYDEKLNEAIDSFAFSTKLSKDEADTLSSLIFDGVEKVKKSKSVTFFDDKISPDVYLKLDDDSFTICAGKFEVNFLKNFPKTEENAVNIMDKSLCEFLENIPLIRVKKIKDDYQIVYDNNYGEEEKFLLKIDKNNFNKLSIQNQSINSPIMQIDFEEIKNKREEDMNETLQQIDEFVLCKEQSEKHQERSL